MGVLRFFFQRGAGKTNYKLKNILFSSKSKKKHTIFGEGGARVPSCPPHGYIILF